MSIYFILMVPPPPQYDMGRSTFLMACNQSGSFDAGFASRWGIVDYDWSNWKEGPTGWAGTIPNDCEEKLVTQAVSTKAANNTTKVFVCEGSLPSCCPSHTAASHYRRHHSSVPADGDFAQHLAQNIAVFLTGCRRLARSSSQTGTW